MTTDTQNIPQSPDRDAAEYLLYKVSLMRNAQKAYFARRMTHDKNESIRVEKEVDDILLRYKARGYNGDRFKDKVTQSKLL